MSPTKHETRVNKDMVVQSSHSNDDDKAYISFLTENGGSARPYGFYTVEELDLMIKGLRLAKMSIKSDKNLLKMFENENTGD